MVANRNALKSYAPQARKDFIQAMTNRAALFGVTKSGIGPGEERGELFLIGGKAYPRIVAEQHRRLVARIEATSFEQTMEAVAYTWFNRLLAIRYMELHGYFEHGYRVLSHPGGEREPEILQQAQHLKLPGLAPDTVVQLKLEGDKDEVLYRRILIAQCNDLHRAMPFLFERIDDETELLLPENLLQSDSIVRKLVNEIEESEWDEIEIIGWLYQFYISEKKDQVIGKVVKSEDIPAATQLFTPNWIVKYMVQNSLGAQWLASYPQSPLKSQMAYYIDPAEQTEEVRAQLAAITPRSLEPEAITLIDPAVGSGHILVEAYDLLRAIYLERGYPPREAARAILTKNLYGLDIDDRAAQMAGFALLMKARADDRTLLRDPPALNVMSLADSGGWDASAMADALMPTRRVELLPSTDLLPETLAQPTLSISAEERGARAAIAGIVVLFHGAKAFGSLMTVPEAVMASLPVLEALLTGPVSGDLLRRETQIEARERLAMLVAQAKVLGRRYDCVVANPPYMGGKAMNSNLKAFVQREFPDSKADLFAVFIERNIAFSKIHGFISMITMQSWMFLSSYEILRHKLLTTRTISSLLHFGTRAFDSIGGEVVSTTAFTIRGDCHPSFVGNFVRLVDGNSEADKRAALAGAMGGSLPRRLFNMSAGDFVQIPGQSLAYWLSRRIRDAFSNPPLVRFATFRAGLQTGDNDRFLRLWHEVDRSLFFPGCSSREESVETGGKWFPHNKGGGYRKWHGNKDYVINWRADGSDIKEKKSTDLVAGKITANNSKCWNQEFYFRAGLTWSSLSSGKFAIRSNGPGFLFDTKGQMLFGNTEEYQRYILCFLNSNVANALLEALAPTLDFNGGVVAMLPVVKLSGDVPISTELIEAT